MRRVRCLFLCCCFFMWFIDRKIFKKSPDLISEFPELASECLTLKPSVVQSRLIIARRHFHCWFWLFYRNWIKAVNISRLILWKKRRKKEEVRNDKLSVCSTRPSGSIRLHLARLISPASVTTAATWVSHWVALVLVQRRRVCVCVCVWDPEEDGVSDRWLVKQRQAGGRRASCWLMCPSVADRGLCFGPCRLSGWRAALFRGHEWAKKEKRNKGRVKKTANRHGAPLMEETGNLLSC